MKVILSIAILFSGCQTIYNPFDRQFVDVVRCGDKALCYQLIENACGSNYKIYEEDNQFSYYTITYTCGGNK